MWAEGEESKKRLSASFVTLSTWPPVYLLVRRDVLEPTVVFCLSFEMSVRSYLIFRIAVNAAWGAAFIALPEVLFNRKLSGELQHLAASDSSSRVISLLSDSFVSLGYSYYLLL